MGRDKSALRLGGRPLLAHVRAVAKQLDLPVRVIRRDIVERCGPLGGVITALRMTQSQSVLFLACDMPFVSATLLQRLVRESNAGQRAAFACQGDRCGFPFLLPQAQLGTAEAQRQDGDFSLQSLARNTTARRVRVRTRLETLNANTPEDFEELVHLWDLRKPAARSKPTRLSARG